MDIDCDSIVNFVIMKVYPDYKRPSINQFYGQCKKKRVECYFIRRLI